MRKREANAGIRIALIHYPVYDQHERVVATALTTLDIHDLARLTKTYGIKGLYIVTPLQSQQALANRLIAHWVTGWGARYNPTRQEALALVKMADDLEAVVREIEREEGRPAKTVATAARRHPLARPFKEVAELLRKKNDTPYLILFGTGWGMTRELIEQCNYVLEPIEGNGYNHLSVRTAAAIILDRLLRGEVS
jgi:hypothetical protein